MGWRALGLIAIAGAGCNLAAFQSGTVSCASDGNCIYGWKCGPGNLCYPPDAGVFATTASGTSGAGTTAAATTVTAAGTTASTTAASKGTTAASTSAAAGTTGHSTGVSTGATTAGATGATTGGKTTSATSGTSAGATGATTIGTASSTTGTGTSGATSGSTTGGCALANDPCSLGQPCCAPYQCCNGVFALDCPADAGYCNTGATASSTTGTTTGGCAARGEPCAVTTPCCSKTFCNTMNVCEDYPCIPDLDAGCNATTAPCCSADPDVTCSASDVCCVVPDQVCSSSPDACCGTNICYPVFDDTDRCVPAPGTPCSLDDAGSCGGWLTCGASATCCAIQDAPCEKSTDCCGYPSNTCVPAGVCAQPLTTSSTSGTTG